MTDSCNKNIEKCILYKEQEDAFCFTNGRKNMGLVAAKCPQCGANIKVDKEYKNGTKFIIDILKKERDNNE